MQTVNTKTTSGKRHPGRNLIIALVTTFLVMAGVGAAVQAAGGDVKVVPGVPGDGKAEVKVASSQALAVVAGSVAGAKGRVFTNEDGTAFKAPAEVCTGDRYTINLALANRSNSPIDAQITVSSPEEFTVDVRGKNAAKGLVRTGPNTWAFGLDANESDEMPDLAIRVAVSDVAQPGNYGLQCVIEPLMF